MNNNFFIPEDLLYKVVGAVVIRTSTNTYSSYNGTIFMGEVKITPEIDISDDDSYRTKKIDSNVNNISSYTVCKVNTLLDRELNDLGINYAIYVTDENLNIDINLNELKSSKGYKSFRRLNKISSLNNDNNDNND